MSSKIKDPKIEIVADNELDKFDGKERAACARRSRARWRTRCKKIYGARIASSARQVRCGKQAQHWQSRQRRQHRVHYMQSSSRARNSVRFFRALASWVPEMRRTRIARISCVQLSRQARERERESGEKREAKRGRWVASGQSSDSSLSLSRALRRFISGCR